jgi:hypothetical protein
MATKVVTLEVWEPLGFERTFLAGVILIYFMSHAMVEAKTFEEAILATAYFAEKSVRF